MGNLTGRFVTKQISSIIKNIKNRTVDKMGILKNNRLEVVVISTEEYARLKELEITFEKQRLQTTLSEYQKKCPSVDRFLHPQLHLALA
jgi:PHD/YefM family antitoxin component YafN of YafNO toxin-antitoxin module